ncbi:glycoside hydrolase family 2 TIM barrel-domain containing protein [Aquabacterium humicola]|uniref:glycoside hydrolase family 2 TIM barrel-domain containing protein n=1 Tax=Aquabacterium humicola TaxID=3237377 RepID=UPI0025428446|nr:glycoside hydrolase family 2 TIM barrel-domain containing protein [Rubrivivax pictus]
MPWRALQVLSTFGALLGIAVLLLAAAGPAGAAGAAGRERLSLDAGWLFHRGDVPAQPVKGHGASYHQAKAGGAVGAGAPDFDDSGWRRLDLPHDWAIENPLDRNENASQGYRARGFGWYRRYFQLPEADRGRHIELQFDGIATHSTVWVNGIVVDRNFSGYNGRSIDVTPFVRYGEDVNSIAVRVDAQAQEGWWYEGAGIYRHAWLVKRDSLHIATDGVHANPVQKNGRWTVPVAVDVRSADRGPRDAVLKVRLIDPDGTPVARGSRRVRVAALATQTATLDLAVPRPQMWSVNDPRLYKVEAALRGAAAGPRELDRAELHTGFRTIRFDAERGFFLNGQPLKLHGVCIHQDHAGVGVAVPAAIWEFRLRRLKQMGVNAVRFAHNAVAPEVMDLTDRLGLLVMNENRNFSASAEVTAQLEWLVRRDRNRPSVILWSIFNEEPLQSTEQGLEMARRMVATIKRLDPTRPVTAGMHDGLFAERNAAQALDVVGINYQTWAYDRYHREHPGRPLLSSEDTSAFMTRGAWASDQPAQVLAGYDEEPSSWGATHRESWKQIASRPFLAGAFVWSGIDYHGEPTPFEWPSASTFFGAIDLTGAPKAAFHIRQAHWVKPPPDGGKHPPSPGKGGESSRERPFADSGRTVVKVLPHWNWAGREGQPVKVMVASNAPRVRLLLNGSVVGEQDVDPIDMVSFQVPYAPGRLEAVALGAGAQAGRELGRDVVETTGAPVRLVLTPDRAMSDRAMPGTDGRAVLAGDGRDAIAVMVSAVDAQGRAVPTANLPVRFDVAGAGRLIGVGNGDPNSHESSKAPERSLFNGLAQVILQSRRNSQGTLTLRASAPGLQGAELALPVQPVAPVAAVPVAEAVTRVDGWRISPPQAERPDPNQVLAGNDMNSWGWGTPPIRQTPEPASWRAYRANLKLRADRNDGRGRLVFREIVGQAEVWADGVKLGEKTTFEASPLTVPLVAGSGWRTLTVLVRAQPGQPSGLTGRVFAEAGTP